MPLLKIPGLSAWQVNRLLSAYAIVDKIDLDDSLQLVEVQWEVIKFEGGMYLYSMIIMLTVIVVWRLIYRCYCMSVLEWNVLPFTWPVISLQRLVWKSHKIIDITVIWRGKRIILCIHLEIATNREWLCKISLQTKTQVTLSSYYHALQ